MVVEDYGESDSKLVKVSIIEGKDIFVVGNNPCRRNPKIGEVFLRSQIMEQAVSEVMSSLQPPYCISDFYKMRILWNSTKPSKIRLPFSDGDTEFAKPVPNPLTLALKEDFTDAEGV